ncbi:MAG: M20/M25/M40 family metallo-hydrolase [Nitrospiraceae bacterium]|nr:M20/M25/M40 family metallo-hydrolase [Nitrospiraceae bacterium]
MSRVWRPLEPLTAAIALGVFLLLTALAALYAHRPPRPRPETAPPAEFSAARAARHIAAFAQVPHRAGTEANYRVRDYLLDTLRGMGTRPRMVEPMVVHGDGLASPQNVLVRLPGANSTKAFMLCAHYDSVPYGPGAADDGAGVATMLETCRALLAGPPLRNDVIFLFTDGEECGLRGARAFVKHNDWAKDVGLMLNFEARGTRGPSYMFETSRNNGWIIREMAKASSEIISSSLMFDVYEPMPTTSDYEVFKETIPGMNCAFVGNFPYYHTPNDKPANVNRASLQHHGAYALDFARHFGNLDLDRVREEPDAVHFNVFGRWLVRYPGLWNGPMTGLAVVALLSAVVFGLVRERLTPRGVVWGFVAFGAAAVAAMAAIGLGLFAAYEFRGLYLLYRSALYGGAFTFFVLAIFALVYQWCGERLELDDMAAGAILWWGIALIAVYVRFPGAAFLFMWPLLFASLGLAVTFRISDVHPTAPGRLIVMALYVLPGILLVIPNLYALMAALTVFLAPGLMLLFALLLGLAIQHLDILTMPDKRWLPASAGALGVLLFAAALMLGGFSEAQPKFSCLSYGFNASTGRAYWLSADAEPDEWTSQFFPPGTQRERAHDFGFTGAYLKAEAPVAPLAPPAVEVLSDTVTAGGRILRLRVRSPRKGARLALSCNSETAVSRVTVNGVTLGQKGKQWKLKYAIFPRSGMELEIQTGVPARPIQLQVVDTSFELPEFPSESYTPRPKYMISEPNTVDWGRRFRSGQTLVAKSFNFEPPGLDG